MMQEARGKRQDKGIIGSKLTKKCHSERNEESDPKGHSERSKESHRVPSLRSGQASGFTLRMTAIPSFAKICVLIFLFLCPVTVYSEIYKWTDEKGEVHFSDNYSNIPEQYLNQVQRKPVKPAKDIKEKTSPQPSPLKEKETAIEKPSAPIKEETKVKEGVSPDDPNAVTIDGGVKEEATEKKEKVIYSGSAKNNSNAELNSVEITFTIRGKDGKEENLSLPIKGKKGEGVLEQGETASFSVQPETPFPLIAGYGYNFKWKFTTGQPK